MTIFQAYGKTSSSLVEVPGIDPPTSRMLSECSAILAKPPLIAHRFAVILHSSLRNGQVVRDSEGFNPGLWTYFWTTVILVKLTVHDFYLWRLK